MSVLGKSFHTGITINKINVGTLKVVFAYYQVDLPGAIVWLLLLLEVI